MSETPTPERLPDRPDLMAIISEMHTRIAALECEVEHYRLAMIEAQT